MPSVEDVYDQLIAANGHLVEIHNDGVAIATATANVGQAVVAVDASVDQVNATLVAGFTALSQALAVLAQLQAQQLSVLVHLSHQQDTMICELEHISRNTCGILNEAHAQTGLQQRSEAAVSGLEEMYATDHADAALSLQRRHDLQAEVERCCPQEVEPPPCDYEPCDRPKRLEVREVEATVPEFKATRQPRSKSG